LRADHATAPPADAPQLQTPPASVQRQWVPQAHAAALACGVAAAAWQPHVQPAPGQAAHWQGVLSIETMMLPFCGGEPGGSVATNSVDTKRRRIERNG
jgi:hypothetical protein